MLSSEELHRPNLRLASAHLNHYTSTYNDPNHCNPHRQPPPCLLAKDEREDTPRKAPEIVNRHDNPLEPRRRMIKHVQEVRVADNTTKHALVVAKKHKRELTCDGDGGAQLEAPAVPVELWCFDHDTLDLLHISYTGNEATKAVGFITYAPVVHPLIYHASRSTGLACRCNCNDIVSVRRMQPRAGTLVGKWPSRARAKYRTRKVTEASPRHEVVGKGLRRSNDVCG